MFGQAPIPVFIVTGFLDSGKTTLVKETLMEQEWIEPGLTLLIRCEEGEEEYEREYLDAKEEDILNQLKDNLLSLSLEGKIVGILHVFNDSLSDAVKNEKTVLLYGQDYFTEEILGMKFKISPFSFFQTNSLGAEVLYDTVREYVGGLKKDKLIFDLYSGTGTIAQILAPMASKVVGVELVEEAVEALKNEPFTLVS